MLKKLKNAFWRERSGAFEKCDSKPMAIPVGFRKPITLEERMQRLLQGEELRRYALQKGIDTPEEFDDFGDEHDPDLPPATPYEVVRNPSTGREMSRAESEAFERAVSEKVAQKVTSQRAAAKSKKDAASKGFKEEKPDGSDDQ